MMKQVEAQNGFTLLETIVALVIASASLIIILQSFSGGFRAKTSIDHQLTMARLAQSKLDEITSSNDIKLEPAEGEFGNGYAWRSSLTPHTNELSTQFDAYWATVEVYRTGPRAEHSPPFQLKTLMLIEQDTLEP